MLKHQFDPKRSVQKNWLSLEGISIDFSLLQLVKCITEREPYVEVYY